MTDKLVYTSLLENTGFNYHPEFWQGPLQPLAFWKLKQLTRWKTLDKYRTHNAGFTCDKCPEPLRNTQHYDNYRGEWYWINTIRCKPCRDKKNLWERFKDWFEQTEDLANKKEYDIYFASVTRQHGFVGDALEIRNPSVDACLEIIKDFKQMIHVKSNNIWKFFNSGLVVGEVKWRRPNTPVYDTSQKEWFPSNFLGMTTWGRVPIRFTEEYEAHPHCHFVGLTPKIKMPYKELNDIAHANNMNVHFEKIPAWRAKLYLSRYFKKDQPSYIDGTKPRCRFKTGELYGYKM